MCYIKCKNEVTDNVILHFIDEFCNMAMKKLLDQLYLYADYIDIL
jgi:hypothetical protein